MRKSMLFSLLCCLALLSACGAAPKEEEPASCDLDGISRVLGFVLSGEGVVENWDTHGGFHGDGRAYVEVTFDSAPALPGIWNELPMPEDLAALVRAYVTDNVGAALFPAVENGHCFFLDRQTEQEDHSPAAVQARASMNFTVALYDADTMTLYYYELDT